MVEWGKNRISLALVALVSVVAVAVGLFLLTIPFFYLSFHYPTMRPYAVFVVLLIPPAIVSASVLHQYIRPKTPTEKKDYVQLLGLAVGGVVGFITVYFAWVELQEARQNTQWTLETAQEVERNRASEAALQSCLGHMQTLIASHDLSNQDEVEGDVRAVAQAQTISLFSGIRSEDKSRPLLFLYKAGLIGEPIGDPLSSNTSTQGIIDLGGANLSEAQLKDTSMDFADLSRTTLTDADLSYADMRGAQLDRANLVGANLERANLSHADLTVTELFGAYLVGANLENAEGLDTEDLNCTIGSSSRGANTETKLPSSVKPPGIWSMSINDQRERLPARRSNWPPTPG